MAKDAVDENIMYSETISKNGLISENQQLVSSVEQLQRENRLVNNSLTRLQEESAMLRELFASANAELANIKKPSLLVADVVSVLKKDKAVVKLPNGNKFYSYVSKETGELRSGDTALVDQKSLNIVQKIELGGCLDVEKYVIVEKPKEGWKQIGGLKEEIQEIKEVIELPLNNPGLFEKVGIQPPRGILLHGPPGTGKTLLAKAVAHSTKATFIEVVGSELVQKFIGEGAKLVKEIFALARKKSPAIVFIDEIDALAATRMDTGTSGEREVNRTFMQLLAEIDGFKSLDNVKIIGATNRIDILDKAIIRPGRLDRLIEVSLPSVEERLEILNVHTKQMNLQKVKLKVLAEIMDNCSGAEIRAICTEAGFFAIREERDYVKQNDFLEAIEKVRFDEDVDNEHLFG